MFRTLEKMWVSIMRYKNKQVALNRFQDKLSMNNGSEIQLENIDFTSNNPLDNHTIEPHGECKEKKAGCFQIQNQWVHIDDLSPEVKEISSPYDDTPLSQNAYTEVNKEIYCVKNVRVKPIKK